MNITIKPLPTFVREAKRLNKRYRSLPQDLRVLEEEILANPSSGTDLGGGVRKIRMRISAKNKGKSGGARVITVTVITTIEETQIGLLYIYDKAERESITEAEIKALLKACGLV